MSDADTPSIEREHFIPFSAQDLVQLCLDNNSFREDERQRFADVCNLLLRYYHLYFHEKLRELKHSYAAFNPDADTILTCEVSASDLKSRQQRLIDVLKDVVLAANYRQVTQEDLDFALQQESLFHIQLDVNYDDFEQILFYRRGESIRKGEVRSWFGLHRKTIKFVNYDRVLIYVKFKDETYFTARQRKDMYFKPGTTMIKLFRNIPRADLEMLFPNTEVAMRLRDKIYIGVPAAFSGVLVLVTKLGSTLVLILALLTFWLGYRDEPVFIDQTALLALGAGLASLGVYLWKQFNSFKNRKIRFMKVLTENLYFKNLDNNAGVFHRLIDAAEEAESKETVLAYYFLVASADGMTRDEIDQAVESWLAKYGGMNVDFEIEAALEKLDELGLIEHIDERLHAVSLDTGLKNLRAACARQLSEGLLVTAG
ncbi:MAG: DUF3754 domain-containing protein [Pseudomonadales bacterium]